MFVYYFPKRYKLDKKWRCRFVEIKNGQVSNDAITAFVLQNFLQVFYALFLIVIYGSPAASFSQLVYSLNSHFPRLAGFEPRRAYFRLGQPRVQGLDCIYSQLEQSTFII